MHFIHPKCVYTLILSLCPLAAQTEYQSNVFDRANPHAISMANLSTPLSGELKLDEHLNPSQYRVQIVDSSRRSVLAETIPGLLGHFEIPSCPAGIHELRVVTQDGTIVRSTGISLPYHNTLIIDLQHPLPVYTGRPISIGRMQHKIPKKALQEYQKAQEAMAKHKTDEMLLHMERALNIDPQFFEAANNLGALYMQQRRLSEAFELFRRAVTIDSADPTAEANLAYVLLRMNRFNEAEAAARASVRSDAMSGRARFLLAVSLLEQKKNRKEAIFHLTQAREQFEPAKSLLKKLNLEDPTK